VISCFGDTSYFIALLVPDDVNHTAAHSWSIQSRIPIVTTEYVILEVANFLSPVATRQLFESFLSVVRGNPRMSLVPTSFDLLQRGCALYVTRKDKAWSLTDCISFDVMRDHKLVDVLTADHHFEQAGFNIMLKMPQ
jgi:predicted nucleic acid-binding protein